MLYNNYRNKAERRKEVKRCLQLFLTAKSMIRNFSTHTMRQSARLKSACAMRAERMHNSAVIRHSRKRHIGQCTTSKKSNHKGGKKK